MELIDPGVIETKNLIFIRILRISRVVIINNNNFGSKIKPHVQVLKPISIRYQEKPMWKTYYPIWLLWGFYTLLWSISLSQCQRQDIGLDEPWIWSNMAIPVKSLQGFPSLLPPHHPAAISTGQVILPPKWKKACYFHPNMEDPNGSIEDEGNSSKDPSTNCNPRCILTCFLGITALLLSAAPRSTAGCTKKR